jgi:type I restriction enzyme, S subunit
MKWKTVRLGDIVKIKTGKLDANASSTNGMYPFFTCSKEPLKISTYSYDCECVLVAGNGDLNVKYYTGKFDAYQRTYIIESLKLGNINIKYLYYFLDSYLETLRGKSIGGVIKYIKLENLTEAEIPLPPLAEQERIAGILDAADALRRKDAALLAAYNDLAQAIFIEMFGDPVRNEKGWEVASVISYCDCIVPGRDKPKSFTGNTPWVTTDDLNHLETTIISKKSLGLSDSEIKAVRARVIPSNSVIMTCVGDLGVISVNSVEMVINQQLHAFQCGKKLNPYFLMYNLFKQKDYMYKMASSTTVPYMNKTVCNSIPILCPPIENQNQFETKILSITAQKDKIQKKHSTALFSTLLHRAFAGDL